MKYTLITGASQGIGLEMVSKCASLGHNILLVSLPNGGLESISIQTKEKFGVDADFFEGDLTKLDTAELIFNWTQEKGYKVNFLVNNAGFGGVGSFDTYSFEYVNRMIDLNIRATANLTHYFIPELKKNAPSYLLNTASMAANFPFPYKTLYAASKVFVKNFTIGLRQELKPYNVKVSLLQPGAAPTNSVVIAQIKSGGFFSKISVKSVESIVNEAIDSTLKGKAVITPGHLNKINLLLLKLFPKPILQWLLAKQGKSMREN